MVREYVAEGSNSYHYLTVEKIYKGDDIRFLHCVGKRFFRDLRNKSGYKVEPYLMRVKVLGMLVDYVDYEVSPNECIFVIGHFANSSREVNGTKVIAPILVADAIMKPDYLKYYKNKELGER